MDLDQATQAELILDARLPEKTISPSGARARTRAIPSRVRERVLEKAGYQCQYQGPRGGLIGRASERCTQRTGLEVDHLQAIAKRGPSDEGNLQVLCKAHNLFRAEIECGGEFIREKIAKRRQDPDDL